MPTFQNSDLFSRGLALLAFVLAFYTLAARERKTPYLARSIYSIIWFVFASMILSALAPLIGNWNERIGRATDQTAWLVLASGMLYVIFGVWTAYNRHANFRDDGLIKHLKIVRWAKNYRRSKKSGSTYEHDPIKFPDALIQSLNNSPVMEKADVERIKEGNYLSAAAKIRS